MKVLKFGAVWCPGCLVMKPLWKKIEEKNSWLETEYYDFDTDKDVFVQYKIEETLPSFIFLDKSGNEFLRLHGEIEEDELLKIINENKNK